jgi:hypothetical protein
MNKHKRFLVLEIEVPAFVPEQADDIIKNWINTHLANAFSLTSIKLINHNITKEKK